MQHSSRAHLGQQLNAEAVAQLRALDRMACQLCYGIRIRTNPQCGRCDIATPTRALILGDVVPDARIGQHNLDPGANAQGGGSLDAPREPTESHNSIDGEAAPVLLRAVSLTAGSKETLPFLQRPSPLLSSQAVASRFAIAWAESLQGSMSGDETWALLCRYRRKLLLADLLVGTDRNEELKRRLRLWERGEMDSPCASSSGSAVAYRPSLAAQRSRRRFGRK